MAFIELSDDTGIRDGLLSTLRVVVKFDGIALYSVAPKMKFFFTTLTVSNFNLMNQRLQGVSTNRCVNLH